MRATNGVPIIPPQNIEAERAVLGACLQNAEALALLRAGLPAEAFFLDRHRVLAGHLLRLAAEGTPVDLVTVGAALAAADALDTVGGRATLAELVEEAALAVNTPAYITLIAEAAAKRELIAAGAALMHEAQNGAAPASILLVVAERLQRAQALGAPRLARPRPRPLVSVLDALLGELETGARPTLAMPFPRLNQLLAGGLHPGEYALLGARPGLGKTALALEIATAAPAAGYPTLVISLEMRALALGARIFAQQGEVSASRLRSAWLSDEDWRRLRLTRDLLQDRRLWLEDQVSRIADLDTLLGTFVPAEGIRLLIVDYVQLLRATRPEDRRLEVEHASSVLKAAARQYGLIVLALCSLNRASITRDGEIRPPQLSDLRETAALEHDCDHAWFLHRDTPPGQELDLTAYEDHVLLRDAPPARAVTLFVRKGRDSGTGTVSLLFYPTRLSFAEATDREEPR